MKPIFPTGTLFISPPSPQVRRGRRPLNGIRAMTAAEARERRRTKRTASKLSKVLPPCPGLIHGPLTVQISNDSFVRRYIDRCFPTLKETVRVRNREMRAKGFVDQKRIHKDAVVAMLVGTAIDYRIRAYFRNDPHRTPSVQRGLALLQALPEYRKTTWLGPGWEQVETMENVWYRRRKERVATKFIAAFRDFVKRTGPIRNRLNKRQEERLCRYCIFFAYLDSIGRAPLGSSALERIIAYGTPDIGRMLGYLESKVVWDVVGLSRLFGQQHRELLSTFRKAQAGGVLAGSADVGGADFDLIVDRCLFDIKATRKAGITTGYLRQLLGYWLLDYNDQFEIRRLGICLARHGHAEYFDIEREFLKGADPKELRKTFRKEIRKLRRERDPSGRLRSETLNTAGNRW